MKITQATLKKIIKEEIAKLSEERNEPADVAHADRVLSGEEEAEAGARALRKEDETVDETYHAPGDRDDDRHPKRDLDHLYAMVRDLEHRLDKMGG